MVRISNESYRRSVLTFVGQYLNHKLYTSSIQSKFESFSSD